MDMKQQLDEAVAAEKLLPSARDNILGWTESGVLPAWAMESIGELASGGHWGELNDRFYKALEFGTGGMRSRTVGNVVTEAERGGKGGKETPAHAAVGTACLNDFNVVRATIGLFRYCERHLKEAFGRAETPRLVIAHDVRHFSRHFCELTASTWTRLGGYAMIFGGPRSTPQLSFAVRRNRATAGIVITASHNPPHDNGFKVYFEDGGQVVYPHAEGIIHEVYRVKFGEIAKHLEVDTASVVTLPESEDKAYIEVLSENFIDREVIGRAKPKIVFSAIHGTGAVSVPGVLEAVGVDAVYVEEQMKADPNFSTVKSPNPENAEALSMGIEKAKSGGADVIMATDPDADRMGVAVRDEDGEMVLLTGNMIGSIMADYRIRRLKEQGVLPKNGTSRAALIKTFVTTPLQAAIAEKNGLKIIDTLTGFKWIGEKLGIYERELKEALMKESGLALDYDACTPEARRELLLKHSTYYVFGGEESYGYLASDRVRDKDANAAILMFAEVAAWLKDAGRTFIDYLDEIYLRYGYYLESLVNIYYEGAAGSEKIRRILESYRESPPATLAGFAVTDFKDFGKETFEDADGKEIPKQDFYFLDLDNGYQFAVRGSGTEPKIKFYLFAREDVSEPVALDGAKETAKENLSKLAKAIEDDARQRAEG